MLLYVNYPESEELLLPMHNVDFSYPAHMHSCMEFTFCVAGAVEVTVGGQCETVPAGSGVFVPPYAVHSYHTADTSEYYTFLVSRSVLPDFAALFAQRVPDRYGFAMDEALYRHLLQFFSSDRTRFGGKSLLYRACEAFLQENTLTAERESSDGFAVQVVSFVQDHFCEDLTLGDLAHRFNYSYYYVSKRIRQIFGVSFSELLAQYRVAYAKTLLDQGDCGISEAALASGFGSIRSFNRVFLQLTGQTPSAYTTRPAQSQICRVADGESV